MISDYNKKIGNKLLEFLEYYIKIALKITDTKKIVKK